MVKVFIDVKGKYGKVTFCLQICSRLPGVPTQASRVKLSSKVNRARGAALHAHYSQALQFGKGEGEHLLI